MTQFTMENGLHIIVAKEYTVIYQLFILNNIKSEKQDNVSQIAIFCSFFFYFIYFFNFFGKTWHLQPSSKELQQWEKVFWYLSSHFHENLEIIIFYFYFFESIEVFELKWYTPTQYFLNNYFFRFRGPP